SLLSVGSGSPFQVNSSGNMVKVNNVSYSWPGAQGGASTFLANNGSGALSWASAPGMGGSGTAGYIPKFSGGTSLANSSVYDSGGSLEISSVGNVFIRANADTDGYDGGPHTMSFGIIEEINDGDDNLGFLVRDNTNGNANRFFINKSGNVGIGTVVPGAKLDVAGTIKISGGSPGAGKVLTSDAAGLGSWQTPSGGAGWVHVARVTGSYTQYVELTGLSPTSDYVLIADLANNPSVGAGWVSIVMNGDTNESLYYTQLITASAGTMTNAYNNNNRILYQLSNSRGTLVFEAIHCNNGCWQGGLFRTMHLTENWSSSSSGFHQGFARHYSYGPLTTIGLRHSAAQGMQWVTADLYKVGP
ncbi:MAG: hypothetical protein ABII00_19040, partial [Elusimicrobiota bacterium]